MYGLIEKDLFYINKAIKKFDEIEKVVIFGSRAMGNYKKYSDIDISVFGENVTDEIIYKLNDYLNEVYPLPYFFDVLDYKSIKNKELIKHIDTYGKIIYKKTV